MKEKTTSDKPRIRLNVLLDGSLLATPFVRRQYKFFLMLAVLTVVYIFNQYSVKLKLAEIDTLKQQLTEMRYEALYQRSSLMQDSRQSHIKQLVEQRGLDLKESDQPLYYLKVKK